MPVEKEDVDADAAVRVELTVYASAATTGYCCRRTTFIGAASVDMVWSVGGVVMVEHDGLTEVV